MNVKIEFHPENQNLKQKIEGMKKWGIKEEVVKEIRNFTDGLKAGKVNLGRQVSNRTCVKYIAVLRAPLIYLNKRAKDITPKEIEQFDEKLSKDVIKSEWGKPYSANMKKDMRLAVRIWLKWAVGEKADIMTRFFDTRDIKKTPDYLKEQEVEKLYNSCKSAREKYLICVLFDSGARIEEFLNIRFEDIELPTKDQNFVKITLKEEYSKTKGRVISLYWKNSLQAISDYLKERQQEGIKSSEPVFQSRYDAVRMFLTRLGKRVLNKSVNPHLFRHSSATFYASKMNRQELCYRYGWAFSSRMPDTYISRSGMLNKDLDEKFESTELGELKHKLNKEEFERKKLQEDFEKMKNLFSKEEIAKIILGMIQEKKEVQKK